MLESGATLKKWGLSLRNVCKIHKFRGQAPNVRASPFSNSQIPNPKSTPQYSSQHPNNATIYQYPDFITINMSALEEDSNAVAAAAPAVAIEADDSNAAAPPLPPAANNAAADNNIQQDNTTTTAAPMIDLSPYFNTLIDSLHRSNDNVANSAPTAAAAATANGSNNTPQLRSMMVSLLWNGVELIANAGRASFGQQQQNQQQQGGTQFVVDTVGGDNNDTTTAASSTSSIFPPKFAAVYLYAVAQNIVALEEIVLQQERLTTADGNVMDVLDGGVSVKQVAEIISVSFKNLLSRDTFPFHCLSTANTFTHTTFQQQHHTKGCKHCCHLL